MDATTIDLDTRLAERLNRLARATHRTPGEVVRDAVDEYLARHEIDDSDWRTEFAAVVARLRSGVPRDEPPEAIEREITRAWGEVRGDCHTRGC